MAPKRPRWFCQCMRRAVFSLFVFAAFGVSHPIFPASFVLLHQLDTISTPADTITNLAGQSMHTIAIERSADPEVMAFPLIWYG